MLIRPQQALPLARIYWKLFIFKYISKMYRTHVAISDSHQEKENDTYNFLASWILYRALYFGNYRWSKLVKLHRAKERHTPSLSNQASVYNFSLKVAWSGISLIRQRKYCSAPIVLIDLYLGCHPEYHHNMNVLRIITTQIPRPAYSVYGDFPQWFQTISLLTYHNICWPYFKSCSKHS